MRIASGGLAAARFGQQAAPRAIERGHLVDDLEQADQRHVRAVDDDVHAGFAHARAAHAEQAHVGARAQGRRQAGCVHVAGGFAGGDQQFDGRHGEQRALCASSRRLAAARRRRASGATGTRISWSLY